MKLYRLLACAAILAAVSCSTAPENTRTTEDFNFGWRFSLGDTPEFIEGGSIGHFEAMAMPQWALPGFDDSSWRELHLPHDWSIEGEFSADNPSTPGGGALPGGIGWYRKHFVTPEGVGNDGKRLMLEFDGIFMNASVYVNGIIVGIRPYGYSSYRYDVTQLLADPGEENVVSVRCDNAEQPNSRWYSGCGIYRDVRMIVADPKHIAYSGIYVTTPEISESSASVHVEATATRFDDAADHMEFEILDARGRKVASASGVSSANLTVARPHLWDLGDTYMYTVRVRLFSGDRLCDVCDQKFGIRQTAWDVDEGFFLNGRPVKILGVCLHHDQGCLGTAFHKRAMQRELQILKDMGVNAVRTSHNPPAPQLLDMCDEMGFLVMDEAFDMWLKAKTKCDYSRFFEQWHEKDLRDFVLRDRNHPSIIMWSIGNEVPEQHGDSEPEKELARHLASIVRELDTTRVITAGCDGVYPENNLLTSGALDVFGFNYHLALYDSCRVWFPDMPLIGSETHSSLNSRGVYMQPSTVVTKAPVRWDLPYDTEHHQCSSYDNWCAPWANLHEESWIALRDRKWMAGGFIWTGFDYIGEPTPYSWPSRSSYFGIVDLAGFPKDAYWLYQSEWTDTDVLHLFPHWNWNEGDTVDVWCYYNNADEVELLVNGESLGRSAKTDSLLHVQWLSVPWKAGKIEAVAYKDGKEVRRTANYTTGAPVSLRLTADRNVISADGYDLSYVTVEALDADGRAVPTACDMLQFSVEGAGELAGVDNGNSCDTLSLKGTVKPLFNGRALAVIRSLKDTPGTATLTVSSSYSTVKLNIDIK